MVLHSIITSLPISIITDKIMAIETMFIVSKNADITLDFLSFGMSGFKNATNKKDGRKMPIVAAIAPLMPPICQPINVAKKKQVRV
jgi:hypothetical protein